MAFIPHSTQLIAPGAAPDRWMLFLHGILGSGMNWRSFAQRLIDAHPTWGAVLVDLRMHGQSQDAPPPHTLATAAEDLRALAQALTLPVRGILGHSFGGKVALQYLSQDPGLLSHAFILDSLPGRRPLATATELTMQVLAVLRSVPLDVASRGDFVASLEARGIEKGVAQWLATNLERSETGFRFRLSLAAIDHLMEDYFDQDLWPVYERIDSATQVKVVVGGRSEVFKKQDLARMESLAAAHSNLTLQLLPKAGHWLHVDDPEGLFQAISPALSH